MNHTNEYNIDAETIHKLGLRRSEKHVNPDTASKARVFEIPGLEDVFIMESDLYGNPMPEGSCFLAFYGTHGLMGKHLKVETLRNTSVEDLKNMVKSHSEG